MACISATGIVCAAPTRGWATSPAITRARRTAPLALLAATLLGGAAPVARLDVALEQVRSARGLIRVCLTADPGNFPSCVDDADATVRSVPAGQRLVSFTGLPRGAYAVAVIHDENANHRLDTFAGIPREGFGFSRNPAIGFGPPQFAAARFALGTGGVGDADRQQVRMRYIL